LFSNHCRNSEIINKKQEINSKLNEIEDVKRKYQRALNNIQKLEEQVMDKLQKEEVIIE
jgi:DNA repair ATPase RecN